MSFAKTLPGSRFFIALAAIGLTVLSVGVLGALQTPKADAAGFVFASMGTGCSIDGAGVKTLRLRASARSFYTTITRVTVNVGGGAPEYDSGAISTTSFGPQQVNVVLTPGVYPIVMTVSSTGNPDVIKNGTATITTFGCRVQTS